MAKPSDTEATLDAIIDQAARELAEEAEQAVSKHPETETLVAFHEGRLTPGEAQRVRDHLAESPACREELAQLEDFSFDTPDLEHLEPEPEVTNEAWRQFQQAAGSSEEKAKVLTLPEPVSMSTPQARSPETRSPQAETPQTAANEARSRLWLPWVASILLALGLGYLLGNERTPREAPFAPNVFFGDLRPDGSSVERSNASETELEVPAGMDTVTLRLNFGPQAPDEAYRAELVEDEGAVVWQNAELLRQPTGQFVVSWQRHQVPSGRYRLRIFSRPAAPEGEPESRLATYLFRLRYADP